MTETESRIVRWLESIDKRLRPLAGVERRLDAIERRLDVVTSVLASHGAAIAEQEQERLREVGSGSR